MPHAMCTYQPPSLLTPVVPDPVPIKTSSHSPPTIPLSTFHLFPQLYTELRLKIWHFALEPRVVTIHYSPSTCSFRSPTPAPPLLHTNRESRHEAQRFYPLLFGTVNSPSHIPFHPSLDTLYFPRRGTMGYDDSLRDFGALMAQKADLERVRVVALDSVDLREKRPWESYDKAVFIKSFPRLEAVVLVCGPKRSWLSNIPRAMGPVREERQVEFVEVEAWEGGCIVKNFEAAFYAEEETLCGIRGEMGMEYAMARLPPVFVVSKRAVERG